MTIAAAGTAVRAITNTTTSHQITLANVALHDSLALGFLDRTGGAVINSVTDDASGTWTQRATHTSGTTLMRIYVREDAAAAASLVITVTTNASQNAQLVASRFASNAGGAIYPTYDAVATSLEVTAATNWDSNTAAATTLGGIVGFIGCSSSQSLSPTMDGAGESNLVATEAGGRSFMFFEAYAVSGNYGFEVTLADSATGGFMVVALKESVAAGGAPRMAPMSKGSMNVRIAI